MTSYVISTFQVEGFHHWKDASEGVYFLRSNHRHIFHIEAKIKVGLNDNREVEFITFKRELENYIERVYGKPAQFSNMSCEMIAADLVEAFNLHSCSVSEDGENRAEVVNE